jgi:hypothetical protein
MILKRYLLFSLLILGLSAGMALAQTQYPTVGLVIDNGTLDGLVDFNYWDTTSSPPDIYNRNQGVIQSATYATVQGWLQTGWAGGAWTGTSGIISTSAANDVVDPTHPGCLTIGQMSGAEWIAAGHTDFYDVTGVLPGWQLVKMTWMGDTDFSGRVTSADYGRMDTQWAANGNAPGPATWYQGDLNHSGKLTAADYGLIDTVWASFGGPTPSSLRIVPEPSAIVLLVLGMIGGLLVYFKRKG